MVYLFHMTWFASNASAFGTVNLLSLKYVLKSRRCTLLIEHCHLLRVVIHDEEGHANFTLKSWRVWTWISWGKSVHRSSSVCPSAAELVTTISISAWFRIGWTWCWWSWVISPVPLFQNICRDNFALLRSMVSPTHHDLFEKFWRPDLVWRWSRRRMFDQLVPTLCEDDLYVSSQYPACPAARLTFHFLVSDSSNNHSWALFSCIEVCPALSHIMAAFSVLAFVVVVGCCSSSLLLLKDIRDCLKYNWILNLNPGFPGFFVLAPDSSSQTCWRCWVIGTLQHKLAIVLTTPLKKQVTLVASIKLKMIDTGDASSVKWKFPSLFFVRGHFRLLHNINKPLEIDHSSDRGPTNRQQPWVKRFKYFTVCNVVARFWCVVRFSTCIASS